MLVSHSLVDDASTFKLSALAGCSPSNGLCKPPLCSDSTHPPSRPLKDASLSAKGKQMTGCCLELPWLPARDPCTRHHPFSPPSWEVEAGGAQSSHSPSSSIPVPSYTLWLCFQTDLLCLESFMIYRKVYRVFPYTALPPSYTLLLTKVHTLFRFP